MVNEEGMKHVSAITWLMKRADENCYSQVFFQVETAVPSETECSSFYVAYP
jgi:hypothetical protein